MLAHERSLNLQSVSSMSDDETGGRAVLLLHGWGAPGDDLVPLAKALLRRSTRFFVPAGPLVEIGGGRAWWHLDPPSRPPRVLTDDQTAPSEPHVQVLNARVAVQQLITEIRARYRPEQLIVGGFSQGGALSLDIGLTGAPPVDRVAVLSGLLLADSLNGLRAPRSIRPPLFVSHGRQDDVLPFADAERMHRMLSANGYAVTWRPFNGGHDIPGGVARDLAAFVFG